MEFEPIHQWFNLPPQHVLIAGPCGAESFEQLEQTMQGLAANVNLQLFRAGVWKPRTRPNSFEGMGEEALKWLKLLKEKYGIKLTVEVANPRHVELALQYNIDVLWIGARTTVNPFSVQELAESLQGVDIPVMIKNPVHADLQLWIGAIERIKRVGISRIAAIHRGFHRYGYSNYRNDPMWQLPIELRTLFPELPLICDPSHIAGKRNLLFEIAQKAMDLGYNGLMLESHYQPDVALSDAAQQVTPAALKQLIEQLIIRHAEVVPSHQNILLHLRQTIDEIDADILRSLGKRQEVIEQIAKFKTTHQMTIFQLERWQEMLRTRGQWADKMGISRTHVEKLCQLLHEESIRLQNVYMNTHHQEVQDGLRHKE